MKPAARVGDMHLCPLVNPGPVPHVGGPVSIGCPTVMIGGVPAARVGDLCVCTGPPDSIAMGSPTVMIGGMMAARLGDPTVHGGTISIGCPTVLIGETGMGQMVTASPSAPSPGDAFGLGAIVAIAAAATAAVVAVIHLMNDTETYADGIEIKGSPEFRKETKAALDRLNNTPTGKALIESIGKSGKTVTIEETKANNGYCKPDSGDANKNPDGSSGKGSDSTVKFNPDFKPGGLPNEDVLGHELIHANHNAYGERETGKTGGVKDEELKTVGLPPFPEKGLTENSLRKDLGLPKRTSY
jgi:uncharacterized Zn-binding protein involved in type VI secretion